MKVIIALIESMLLFFSFITTSVKNAVEPIPATEAVYENLGIPLQEHYPTGIVARTAWDVEIFDNKLYIACGDYDANSGPIPIYCYDLDNKVWDISGTVPDEQIEHFKIINDTLMTPGCDPRGDWSYGNIYMLQENKWITNRTIPGGIHQFDLIEFDNKLFVALGVVPGQYPIAVSNDDGKTFQQVIMYKDGNPIDTTVPSGTTSAQIRVYDFFTLNGNLYAYYCLYIDGAFSLEIYHYQNNGFYYHSNMPTLIKSRRTTYRTFDEKLEYNGKVYFTTGNLYVTADMKTVQKIDIAGKTAVTDIRVIENDLYILCATKNTDGSYRTSLWRKIPGEIERFHEIFFFNFPCPAQCFTYHNGTIYFGMGDGILSESDPYNGTILSIYVLG